MWIRNSKETFLCSGCSQDFTKLGRKVPSILLQASLTTVSSHKPVLKSQRHTGAGQRGETHLKKLSVTKLQSFSRCITSSFLLGSGLHSSARWFWLILSELLVSSTAGACSNLYHHSFSAQLHYLCYSASTGGWQMKQKSWQANQSLQYNIQIVTSPQFTTTFKSVPHLMVTTQRYLLHVKRVPAQHLPPCPGQHPTSAHHPITASHNPSLDFQFPGPFWSRSQTDHSLQWKYTGAPWLQAIAGLITETSCFFWYQNCCPLDDHRRVTLKLHHPWWPNSCLQNSEQGLWQ